MWAPTQRTLGPAAASLSLHPPLPCLSYPRLPCIQLLLCKFSSYQGGTQIVHLASVASWLARVKPFHRILASCLQLGTHLAPLTASLLVMKTCAPFRASSRALAKPRPVLAPVIMATLPVRSGMSAADHGAMYVSWTLALARQGVLAKVSERQILTQNLHTYHLEVASGAVLLLHFCSFPRSALYSSPPLRHLSLLFLF